ncbi:MAG: hypothetical protein ACTHM5_00530 [Ginsengibacter sp.]
MKKLFLYKVYRHSKKLFYFFVIFTVLTVMCNLSGFEITPFYVWGMYSEREIEPASYQIYRVTINDKQLDYSTGYFPANRFFLLSPLTYYQSLKESGDPTFAFLQKKLGQKLKVLEPYILPFENSAQSLNEFPDWYKRYLEQTTGKKIKNLQVDVLKVSWRKNNSITVDSAYHFINE